MIALVRTSGEHGDRHKGLSQVLIDLKAPGVNIRPIVDMTGDQHFNQIVFDDVLLPPDDDVTLALDLYEDVSEAAYFDQARGAEAPALPSDFALPANPIPATR